MLLYTVDLISIESFFRIMIVIGRGANYKHL